MTRKTTARKPRTTRSNAAQTVTAATVAVVAAPEVPHDAAALLPVNPEEFTGRLSYTPSPQQVTIFHEFAHGSRHVIIDARAGTGKTTTIIAGIDFAPEARIIMCAFNKVIAEELKKRLRNPRAEAKTLHSLGNSIVYARWGRCQIDDRRGRRLAMKAIGLKNPPREIVDLVAKLASAGKSMAPFATPAELVKIALEFDYIPENKNLSRDEEPWTVEQVANCAHAAMEDATNRDGSIDFDDMVYLPVRCGWVTPRYDMVVVDECQDMNYTQIELALGSCTKNGRIFVVGDPYQAIYGFRGADSSSMARLEKRLNAKRLSLTTTYRCPQKVVAIAQTLVPDFTAAPTAPEGIVREQGLNHVNAEVRPGDFILSRKNAPLAKICLSLLREGKRAIIRGRDIGAGLVKIIRNQDAATIPDLMTSLNVWERNTIDNLIAQEASESRIEMVSDQVATIRDLSEGLATVEELITRMDGLFNDNNVGSSIVCSSIHKAKGLESDRVYLLQDTLYPGGRKDEEEVNIHYVGVTRAKNELVFVC
jgi:DNA helicase-2/ATP-dependent DNA helicase PcrA